MIDANATETWQVLKDILEKGGTKLLFDEKKCDFIPMYRHIITQFIPNVRCGLSQMYAFGIACISDEAPLPGYDKEQGFKDIDLLFKYLKHSCFEDKYAVIDLCHYMAVGAIYLNEVLLYGIQLLQAASNLNPKAELERFKYAVGCDNKGFVNSIEDTADPTPYAIALCNKHFIFKQPQYATAMANLLDFLTLRGPRGLSRLPAALPPMINLFDNTEPVADAEVDSDMESNLLESLASLMTLELVKRSLRGG